MNTNSRRVEMAQVWRILLIPVAASLALAVSTSRADLTDFMINGAKLGKAAFDAARNSDPTKLKDNALAATGQLLKDAKEDGFEGVKTDVKALISNQTTTDQDRDKIQADFKARVAAKAEARKAAEAAKKSSDPVSTALFSAIIDGLNTSIEGSKEANDRKIEAFFDELAKAARDAENTPAPMPAPAPSDPPAASNPPAPAPVATPTPTPAATSAAPPAATPDGEDIDAVTQALIDNQTRQQQQAVAVLQSLADDPKKPEKPEETPPPPPDREPTPRDLDLAADLIIALLSQNQDPQMDQRLTTDEMAALRAEAKRRASQQSAQGNPGNPFNVDDFRTHAAALNSYVTSREAAAAQEAYRQQLAAWQQQQQQQQTYYQPSYGSGGGGSGGGRRGVNWGNVYNIIQGVSAFTGGFGGSGHYAAPIHGH